MDLKKIPSIYIVFAVLAIAVVIILFLASRKAEAGNGGNGGNGDDLINAGTANYIELRPPEDGNIFITYYDHSDDSPYAGANIYPSYTNPTYDTVVPFFLDLWYDDERIIQKQYDNALTQLHDLGY